jgi:hypothetical protein
LLANASEFAQEAVHEDYNSTICTANREAPKRMREELLGEVAEAVSCGHGQSERGAGKLLIFCELPAKESSRG